MKSVKSAVMQLVKVREVLGRTDDAGKQCLRWRGWGGEYSPFPNAWALGRNPVLKVFPTKCKCTADITLSNSCGLQCFLFFDFFKGHCPEPKSAIFTVPGHDQLFGTSRRASLEPSTVALLS